jgi:hypothetical protein
MVEREKTNKYNTVTFSAVFGAIKNAVDLQWKRLSCVFLKASNHKLYGEFWA